MGSTTVPDAEPLRVRGRKNEADLVGALELAWSHWEPERTGEWIILAREGAWHLGRGDHHRNQLHLVREGPGVSTDTGSLLDTDATLGVSRGHLGVRVSGTNVTVENRGDRPMLVNGEERRRAELASGDVVEILDRYVFFFTLRPASIPACKAWPYALHPLGEPDAHEMVGDSPTWWRFRELVARVALSDEHVLVLGETGVGKELVAPAIWRMSRRSKGPFVVVGAPTLSTGLIDTELFGHRANLTDGKMPAATGLIETAEGGVLCLDEIGDLHPDLQHHLLRAIEGRYRRVGDTRDRRADVRWLGVTNSPISSLVGDLFGRLKIVVEVPPLRAHPEDLPALVRSRVLRVWNTNPKLVARFIRIVPGKRDEIAIEPELVTALLRHDFKLNVRELDRLLEQSFIVSEGNTLQPPPELQGEVAAPSKAEKARAKALAALTEHRDMNAAATALGISRYALGRRLGRY